MIKSKKINVKLLENEDFHFTGLGSTYNNEDRDGDIMIKGCFDKSLSNKTTYPMCFNHDTSKVIGLLEVATNKEGLVVKGKFADIPLANEVHTLMKMGALDSLSIGFIVKDYELVDNTRPFGGWKIKEAELLEVSIVTIPANPKATIDSVKHFKNQEEMQMFINDTIVSGIDKALEIKEMKDNLLKQIKGE